MGRKFFQRYSRKYFRYRTGNSSYCLIGEISSLLGNIYLFHNLSGKRSKNSEQISFFVEWFLFFIVKNVLHLRRFMKCSFLFDTFPNSSEISPKIWSIFLKSMKYFHFLQENLCFLHTEKKSVKFTGSLVLIWTTWLFSKFYKKLSWINRFCVQFT